MSEFKYRHLVLFAGGMRSLCEWLGIGPDEWAETKRTADELHMTHANGTTMSVVIDGPTIATVVTLPDADGTSGGAS